MSGTRLTPEDASLEGIVSLSLAAARALDLAIVSLEPTMAQAAKELAAFLLGVSRTLEAIHPALQERWLRAVEARLGRELIELQRTTGEPTFMHPAFLDFLRRFDRSPPAP